MALVVLLLDLLAYLLVVAALTWWLRPRRGAQARAALAGVTAIFAAAGFGLGRGGLSAPQPLDPLELSVVAAAVFLLAALAALPRRRERRGQDLERSAGFGVILVLLSGISGVLVDLW